MAQTQPVESTPLTKPPLVPQLGLYRSYYVWAGLGFALLTLAFSWQIWGRLATAMPGGDIDGFENFWSDWWVRKALLELHVNPFFTSYIYYPTGISLRLHALQLLNGLFTIPLAPLFGPLTATNLVQVWAVWSTPFFSFSLFYYLTRQPLAAFAGGAFLGFCNFQQYEFWGAGQGNLISLEWLPLYALFMLKVGRDEGRRWLNIGMAVGLLFFLTLTDLQYLLFAVLLTVLYGLYLLVGRVGWLVKGRAISRLALVGFFYALLALPLIIIPAIVEVGQSPWLWPSDAESVSKATDLTDYFGWGGRNLGYIPLALALIGLASGWRRAGSTVRLWGLVAAFFGLLSLGPVLLVGGQPLKVLGHTLPMPYKWFSLLPGMRVGRNPSLYEVIWMLAVAALAAYGLTWLLESWASRDHYRPALLTGTLTALAVVPLLAGAATSYSLNDLDVSPFYEELAQDKADYAILEVPPFTYQGRGEDVYQAYQAIHNKWRFGGRLSRDHKLDNPNNFIKANTLLRDFYWLGEGPTRDWHPAKDFLTDPDFRQVGLPLLNFYKVRYIVLYKAALTPGGAKFAQSLVAQALSSVRPVYEDNQLTAYQVPEGAALTSNGGLFADVGDGWYTSETQHGETWRWANDPTKAELYLYNLTSQPQDARLDLTAYSFKTDRDLTIKLNDHPLPTGYHLTETHQPLSLGLKLAPGRNVLTFSSPQPGRSVVDYGFKNDSRVLSFALLGVLLQPTASP